MPFIQGKIMQCGFQGPKDCVTCRFMMRQVLSDCNKKKEKKK